MHLLNDYAVNINPSQDGKFMPLLISIIALIPCKLKEEYGKANRAGWKIGWMDKDR